MTFPGTTRRQFSLSSALNSVPVTWPSISVSDDDYYLTAAAGVFAADTGAGRFIAEAGMSKTRAPDYGRNVELTLTDNAGADLSVSFRVFGKNQFGRDISEDFLALTAAAGKTAGEKMFARVTEIEILDIEGAPSVDDNLKVGYGNRLAIPEVVTRLGAVVSLTLDGVPVDVDADTIDIEYSAIKGDNANGAGSNAGVFAAADVLSMLLQFTDQDEDDHFDLVA